MIFFKGGDDFVVETLTAMFAANSDTACVEFTVVDDMIALEGDETFTVTFTTPPGTGPGSPSPATVTIIDDGGGFKLPKSFVITVLYMCTTVLLVRFTDEDYRTTEGVSAEIWVEGIGQIAQPAMATVSTTTDGTATGGIEMWNLDVFYVSVMIIYIHWCFSLFMYIAGVDYQPLTSHQVTFSVGPQTHVDCI